MKKLIVLLCVAAMVLGLCGVAGALSPGQILQALDDLTASGKQSNTYVDHSIIDLTNVSNGSVVAYTYIGDAETLTTNTFSVLPQENSSATNKITRFMFELTNRYRPDTELPLSVSDDRNTVHAYTYGTMKDEAIWAVVNGLPDCLGNAPYDRDDSDGGSDSSWVDKYSPDQIAATISTATFSINSTTFTVSDTSTNQSKTIEMDVAPEVVNDRTYVPVRYLAYSLGVPESGVQWDGAKETVTITSGDTTVGLTIGSTTEIVNGEPVEMDVAPYIKNIEAGGRTMLPARWIAEPLGATVGWDAESQQVTIEIPSEQGQ